MIKNSLLISITTFATILLGISTTHFLTKYLSVDNYGNYQYILAWIGMLSFFSLNNFNAVVTKAASQNYSRFFRKNNQIRFLFSFIGSIALLIIGWFFKPELIQLFYIAALSFPIYCGLNSVSPYLLGKKKFKTYSIITISSQVIVISFQISIIYFFPYSEYALAAFLLGNSFFYGFYSLYFHQKERKSKLEKDKEKELVRYGFEITSINFANTIATKVQFIILEATAGSFILAIYAAAQIFPEKIKNISKSFLVPINVYLASVSPQEGIKFLRKSFIFFSLIGILYFIVTIITLPIAISIIFGSKYDDSIFYSILLSITLIFLPLNTLFGGFIVNHSFKKFFVKITIYRAIIRILLFWVLIPKFQIMGIILTSITVDGSMLLIYLYWFFKIPKVENTYDIISFRSQNKLNLTTVSSKFEGRNIIKVLNADEIIGRGIPFWAKLIGKVSFTKF